jgi:hypothetical protein
MRLSLQKTAGDKRAKATPRQARPSPASGDGLGEQERKLDLAQFKDLSDTRLI